MTQSVRVAITRQDGRVSVMSFVTDDGTGIIRDATPDLIAAEVSKAKLPSPATAWRMIGENDVPSDRTFRNAWRDGGNGQLQHDMVHAREIWMDRIRKARDEKLTELDRQYMIADEKNDQRLKADIAVLKQKLRDLPQTFDLTVATTPEALKLMWPIELA